MTDWRDAAEVAAELSVPLATLQRMSRRGQYPELLHVARGIYRVRAKDHEAWVQSRMTSAVVAREELQAAALRERLRS